jgi:hypothetical protein
MKTKSAKLTKATGKPGKASSSRFQIILSTHGYTGLKHALLGSATKRVVRHAPCPVLVVRQREHEFLAN